MRALEDKKTARVLLVDDELNILTALQRMLRHLPISTTVATNGDDALNLVSSLKPHVILSDFHMPKMNGAEFLRKSEVLWPPAVRILLSGHIEPCDIEDGTTLESIHTFLAKPWDNDALVAEIKRACSLGIERVTSHNATASHHSTLEQDDPEDRMEHTQPIAPLNTFKVAGVESRVYNMPWGSAQLAQSVAHEINNPLGAILAFAQLMARVPNRSAEDREALEVIEQCALRCKGVVEGLLAFTKSTQASEEMTLQACLQASLETYSKHNATQKVIEWHIDIESAHRFFVNDPQRLKFAVLTLLQFVADALPQERGRLRLSAKSTDTNYGFEISGNMEVDKMMLTRLLKSASDRIETAGVSFGLYVAKLAIEQLGGTLHVEQDQAPRTTFYVQFLKRPNVIGVVVPRGETA